MQLLTYRYKMFGPRAGLKLEDRVVDLTSLLGAEETIPDIGALLKRYPDPVTAIRAALDAAGQPETLALDEVRLCAPVLQPPCVRDSSLFETHSKGASKNDNRTTPKIWYERPIFYYGNPNVICGPEEQVARKPGSTTLDYEAEVALVVGKRGRDVKAENALDYIFGLTIFNDWTDRATGAAEVGFLGMHKSKDFAIGLGPWIVTMDEFMDRYDNGRLPLKVNVYVNGVQTTDSSTDDMYWTIPQLFEVVAQDSVVLPGDLIALGTVGHGALCESGGALPYLQDGDTVEVEVEGIGTLRQYVKK